MDGENYLGISGKIVAITLNLTKSRMPSTKNEKKYRYSCPSAKALRGCELQGSFPRRQDPVGINQS